MRHFDTSVFDNWQNDNVNVIPLIDRYVKVHEGQTFEFNLFFCIDEGRTLSLPAPWSMLAAGHALLPQTCVANSHIDHKGDIAQFVQMYADTFETIWRGWPQLR